MSPDVTGGCYCGAVRFRMNEAPKAFGACHCRPCQHIAGGGPNYFLLLPETGFAYTVGMPRSFRRGDLEQPVTREFCPTCGTHLVTRLPGRDDMVVKVGTLGDPAQAGAISFSIHCAEAPPFHLFAEGAPAFDSRPARG